MSGNNFPDTGIIKVRSCFDLITQENAKTVLFLKKIKKTKKRYKVSYSQHGPECRFQFTKNIDRRFKTQKSQNCKVNAVPNCCPYSLVEGYFDRNHPPALERKKLLKKS